MTTRAYRIRGPEPTGNPSLDQWIRDVTKAFDDTLPSTRTTASSTSFLPTDQDIAMFGAGTTVSLPSGVDSYGKVLRVKSYATGNVYVNVIASGTIDSNTTVTLTQYEALTVKSLLSTDWGIW